MQSHDDAEKAVQLDEKNIKAYFLKGETLVELAMHTKDTANMENGIEQLKKCSIPYYQASDYVHATMRESSRTDL